MSSNLKSIIIAKNYKFRSIFSHRNKNCEFSKFWNYLLLGRGRQLLAFRGLNRSLVRWIGRLRQLSSPKFRNIGGDTGHIGLVSYFASFRHEPLAQTERRHKNLFNRNFSVFGRKIDLLTLLDKICTYKIKNLTEKWKLRCQKLR